MKLTHILWSLLIICGSIFALRLIFPTQGPFGGGLNLYALILLLLGMATTASPVIILLIALRKINPREHFWITLLFTLNFFWGLLLTFEIFSENIQHSIFLATTLAILNLLWAILLLICAIRKPIENSDNLA